MDPKVITDLANLLRNNGDKILSSEFKLTLSGSLLRALNDSFTLIADTIDFDSPQTFQVVKPNNSKSNVFRDLQLVHDFVQKTAILCIIHYPGEEYFDGIIDITKFRCLKCLEIQKTYVKQIIGIQPLRAHLRELICIRSIQNIEDIITNCGGDNSNGFVWNELKIADFSYNNLKTIDSSLEFAQYLQHLKLQHNKLASVEAIKWLPNLKTLDLSYNHLLNVPNFHVETLKRLQVFNLSNNLIEDLIGISKFDALTELDLSDNCLLDHTYLLPLSALITLKYLNLYGNPLSCHPKHRLASAQFLHKNTATVKFILDFEPLSKYEKSLTGTHKYGNKATTPTTSTSSAPKMILTKNGHRLTSSISSWNQSITGLQTPTSSVSSLRSFNFNENDINNSGNVENIATNDRKRSNKTRTVVIEDNNCDGINESLDKGDSNTTTAENKSIISGEKNDHLEKKKQIEDLREKYGASWLLAQNARMVHSILGIESSNDSDKDQKIAADKKQQLSRKIFDDFFADFSTITSSSPKSAQNPFDDDDNDDNQNEESPNLSSRPIKTNKSSNSNEITPPIVSKNENSQQFEGETRKDGFFTTAINQNVTVSSERTVYESGDEDEPFDVTPHLKDVYSKTHDEESEVSEAEEDESIYIVYTINENEPLFLTLSSNFIREKDTVSQRTKTKWSLNILESCDRFKSNSIRINFDTLKSDKRERQYTVEDGLCRELEKKLRDILSKRNLYEMNQTIYRCVNCTCQFSQENPSNFRHQEIRCPDCKSTFVAEIHELPKSLEKAITIVTPDVSEQQQSTKLSERDISHSNIEIKDIDTKLDKLDLEENQNDSTGKGSSRLTATNKLSRSLVRSLIQSSANSLNESSSISKISNPQNSFDSNQSATGSYVADREIDIRSNYESDVDILSNPSQSSIEVLDNGQNPSRKASEERRISQSPNLETINDQSFNCNNNNCNIILPDNETLLSKQKLENSSHNGGGSSGSVVTKKSPLAHINLTESSSSGSVTDSVCTAYDQGDKISMREQQQSPKLISSSQKLINEESGKINNQNNKDETSITSMFGALFQSTNMLMSRSSKLNETTDTPSMKKQCEKYKFNYNDFNDIDHRLKLYFYSMKFEEQGEHFKWVVRGKIFNENTSILCDGIVIMSTFKCYVMEIIAAENDDVAKWLRPITSVTVDRLESVQLLPWKIGLALKLRDWGGFLLLLQDILRTDSLLLYFADHALPQQCDLNYEISNQIVKRLNTALNEEKLKMFSLINSCEIKSDDGTEIYSLSGLFTTDSHLYLSAGNLSWLSAAETTNSVTIEFAQTQLMSNLIDVERSAENVFAINFLDETQNKCELWKCTFETKENAESCLNAIGQSWQKLFGVELFNT